MNIMIAQIAAVAVVIGFFGLMCFQVLLALGLPFGKVAWGGKYTVLPPGLRVASLFSLAIYVMASIFILEKAGMITVFNSPALVSKGVWVLTAFLFLNIISNFISHSRLEKLIMTPITVALGLLCLAVVITAG